MRLLPLLSLSEAANNASSSSSKSDLIDFLVREMREEEKAIPSGVSRATLVARTSRGVGISMRFCHWILSEELILREQWRSVVIWKSVICIVTSGCIKMTS